MMISVNHVNSTSTSRLSVVKSQLLRSQSCHYMSSTSAYRTIVDSLQRIVHGTQKNDRVHAERAASEVISNYTLLETDEKKNFLLTLAREYQKNWEDVHTKIMTLANSSQHSFKAQQNLRDHLVQPYETIFKTIGAADGGVKFLVDLRKDVIACYRSSTDEFELSSFQYMSHNLKQLLSLWFGVGFLQLERITWQSSCDLLEKIAEYEAVHPVRNVSDLRERVGPYRRCFTFTHPSMPREPIVILHVALVKDISSSIDAIVRQASLAKQRQISGNQEDKSAIDTAIFYSITSTKPGLQGIDLGNYLIKTVVRELQAEIPNLNKFSSLSPIPGFRDWIVTEINQELSHSRTNLLSPRQTEILAKLFKCQNDDKNQILNNFKSHLLSGMWAKDEEISRGLKPVLMELCFRYLYKEKHRGFALNSVANFHLRNGATMWRINWMGNTSAKGLNESCGIMVNYRYHLDKVEANYVDYLRYQTIDIDDQVLAVA